MGGGTPIDKQQIVFCCWSSGQDGLGTAIGDLSTIVMLVNPNGVRLQYKGTDTTQAMAQDAILANKPFKTSGWNPENNWAFLVKNCSRGKARVTGKVHGPFNMDLSRDSNGHVDVIKVMRAGEIWLQDNHPADK